VLVKTMLKRSAEGRVQLIQGAKVLADVWHPFPINTGAAVGVRTPAEADEIERRIRNHVRKFSTPIERIA
jgi:hypothetical protein